MRGIWRLVELQRHYVAGAIGGTPSAWSERQRCRRRLVISAPPPVKTVKSASTQVVHRSTQYLYSRSFLFKMAAACDAKMKQETLTVPSKQGRGSTSRAFLILVMVFLTSLLCLFLLYLNFPMLEPSEKQHMKLPRDIEDAKGLGRVLNRYTNRYFFTVTSGFFITYVFLQSFAIPGSIFLSILSGFLFPFPLALFLVCLCSAMGASVCYYLSYLVGRRIVLKYFPAKALQWSEQVGHHRDNLLNYMIFLRITPFLPNWFINIAAPVIDVPIAPFFLGTFVGVAPPSFVAIQAGTTLHQLSSSKDAVSWWSVSVLAAFALLSILPVLFKGKLKQKVL